MRWRSGCRLQSQLAESCFAPFHQVTETNPDYSSILPENGGANVDRQCLRSRILVVSGRIFFPACVSSNVYRPSNGVGGTLQLLRIRPNRESDGAVTPSLFGSRYAGLGSGLHNL